MFITRLGRGLVPLACACALGGCGLTHNVADGTHRVTQAIFNKPLTTLQLDFAAPPVLNSDPGNRLALATQVRVYQLPSAGALSRADLRRLLSNDSQGLQRAWLAVHQVQVRPGQGAQLRVPLAQDTQAVAVVGLFRLPDLAGDDWHVLLRRDQLEADSARVIELHEQALSLPGNAAEAS